MIQAEADRARGLGLTRIEVVAVAVVLMLGLARIIATVVSPLELHPDEAQYWGWAQSLDWGYFSKPPLIAWTIAATTTLFGDAEWAIRVASPVLGTATALLIGALAVAVGARAVAPWAMLGWAVMPGAAVSAAVMSTDALLLPLWTAGLIALWRAGETGRIGWALAFGLLAGLAFLAKYAALYLVGGAVIWLLLDAGARARLGWRGGLAAGAGWLTVAGPNLWWNAEHGFSTVRHTAANANWTAQNLFNPSEALEFLGAQAGVFGPLAFVLLLAGLVLAVRRGVTSLPRPERFLLVFALLPLVIVTAQALVSRAHGNWAASAYPAATVLLVLWFTGRAGRRALAASIGLNAMLAALALTLVVAPTVADAIDQSNAFKRVRGWEDTTRTISAAATEGGYRTIMVDSRLVWHALDYYGDVENPPVRMWLRTGEPQSQAETVAPMQAGAADPVLIVSIRPDQEAEIARDFGAFRALGVKRIDLGGGKTRDLYLYAGSRFAPAPRGVGAAPADADDADAG
jgi:4-amino-4-deoxy-L-arabinose transferase-like glycosyltransferase